MPQRATFVVDDDTDALCGAPVPQHKQGRVFVGQPVHSLEALPEVGNGKYFYYMVVRNHARPTRTPKRCGSPRTLRRLAAEFEQHNVVLFSTTYRPPRKRKHTRKRTKPRR